MKVVLFCLSILLPVSAAFAQSNAKRHPVADSNQWTVGRSYVDGKYSRKEASAMKARVGTLLQFLQDSCFAEPQQVRPQVHAFYGSSPKNVALRLLWKESTTECEMIANDISSILQPISIHERAYYLLPAQPIAQDHLLAFEYTRDDHDRMGPFHTRAWILGGPDKELPYVPVSLSEYLGQVKAALLLTEQKAIEEVNELLPVRSALEQEEWKKAKIEELKQTYTGTTLDVRIRMFLENCKADEKLLEETIDSRTKMVKARIQLVDSLIKFMPLENLKAPAYISNPAAEFDGLDNQSNGRMLVKLNPGAARTDFYLITCTYPEANSSIARHFNPASYSRSFNLITRVP